MLIGVGTDAEERKELMFTVTRDPAGTATTSSGTATALPVSDDAWNASVVLAARAPGFWSVRYSTKPGRTVPSAKRNVVAAPELPATREALEAKEPGLGANKGIRLIPIAIERTTLPSR